MATPWDSLLGVKPPMPRRLPVAENATKAPTKLAGLLDLLAERGPSTTLTLSVCSDLEQRQVWGLLKQPRAIGQVRFDEDCRWSLCETFPGRDVQRAINLLQDKGYRVIPPAS